MYLILKTRYLKMKKLTITTALIATVLASGCSSTYNPADRLEAEHEAQMLLEELKAERLALKQEKQENLIDDLPEWVVTPPKSDGFGVYGVGVGESSKYSYALKKAKLQSEFEAAKQIKSEITGLVRNHEAESGENVIESYSETIENLVTGVPVVGYTVVESEIKSIEGKYHSYVLIHLPYAEFNKAMQQNAKELQVDAITNAFAELERKVEKAKKAKQPVVATKEPATAQAKSKAE